MTTSTKTPHPQVTFTEWVEINRVAKDGGYCGYTEGCPCCTCEENGVTEVTYVRNVWSRSSRVWRTEELTYSLCDSHRADIGPW